MGLSINTKEYAFKYEKYLHVLKGYNNANWIVDFVKSKSTSGYMFTFGGATIF